MKKQQTKSDAILLFVYFSHNELNITKIAQGLKMYNGNVAKLLIKLEHIGFIERHKKKDKKEVIIKLTKKGQNKVKVLTDNFRPKYMI